MVNVHIPKSENKKIRILYVIGQLAVGGSERQLVHLINHIDSERYEPMVCSFSADAALAGELNAQGVKVIILPKKMNPDLTRPFTLYKIVKDFDPDLIHSYLFVANTWSRIIGLILHKPVIVSERNSEPYKPFWMLFIDRLLCPLGTLMIANSESGAERAKKRKEFPPQKIKVIYNGIPIEQYAEEPKHLQFAQEFGIHAGEKAIAVVARLCEAKNHEMLFYVMQKVLRAYPNVRLLCVGIGPRLQELKRLARRLDIEDNIIFTGLRSDIPFILSKVSLLVLPSKWEGTPNVILEALVCGCPVVATRVGGIPEIIRDGETGLLVPSLNVEAMVDAILHLLADENLAREMGRRGQELVKNKYSVNRMVLDTEKVYDEILGSKIGNN